MLRTEAELYPQAPRRDEAPAEVTKEDGGLAKDYKEAVDCEPHSLQAAAFLLGRCMERILIAKAGVERGLTLGPMIEAAIAGGRVPQALCEPLEKGFLVVRNQAGHVWVNSKGEDLRVDEDSVDGSFAIVDALFDELYLGPANTTAPLSHGFHGSSGTQQRNRSTLMPSVRRRRRVLFVCDLRACRLR
ncbi:MAG TPA: hypothetical protein VMZ31_20085, partial [Phycisphaerae bacterium]|nr:hypothetical protein [Phycisphaerae bacterium]